MKWNEMDIYLITITKNITTVRVNHECVFKERIPAKSIIIIIIIIN